MKVSRLQPEWDGERRVVVVVVGAARTGQGGGWDRGVVGVEGVRGPPADRASAKAAVKRGPVFFPRPARRETVPRLARVKSHR